MFLLVAIWLLFLSMISLVVVVYADEPEPVLNESASRPMYLIYDNPSGGQSLEADGVTRYWNESNWVPSNTSLKTFSDYWYIDDNAYEAYFYKNTPTLIYKYLGRTITLVPQDTNAINSSLNGNISYYNLWDDATLIYETQPLSVKEYIYVTDAPSKDLEFIFKVNTSFTPTFDLADGIYTVYDGNTMIAVLPRVKTFDDNGSDVRTRMTASQSGDDYYLTIKIKKNDLAKAVFPITIDPTLDISSNTEMCGDYLIYDTIYIYNGAKLTVCAFDGTNHTKGRLNLTATDWINITAGSSINAVEKGYPKYSGTGVGGNATVNSANAGDGGGGAGHGGTGGAGGDGVGSGSTPGVGGSLYGNATGLINFTEMGSGGGKGSDGWYGGSPDQLALDATDGGGVIYLNAPYIYIQGTVNVTSEKPPIACAGNCEARPSPGGGGGGSGGSIYIYANNFINISKGNIIARGADGGNSASGSAGGGGGGGGAGGRIKIFKSFFYYNESSTITVAGGTGGTAASGGINGDPGAAGTIYYGLSNNEPIINTNTTIPLAPNVNDALSLNVTISDPNSDDIIWVNFTLKLPNSSLLYENTAGTWIGGYANLSQAEEWHSDSLPAVDGRYFWNFSFSDSVYYVESPNLWFEVRPNPATTLNLPGNYTYGFMNTSAKFTLNYTISDNDNYSYCAYSVWNETNDLIINNETLSCEDDINYQTEFNVSDWGTHTFELWVNDTYNNVNSTKEYFTLINDTVAPNITIATPSGEYTTSAIAFSWSLEENTSIALLDCLIEVTETDGSPASWGYLSIARAAPVPVDCNSTNTGTVTITTNGNYLFVVNASDLAGNYAQENASFTVAIPVVEEGGGGGGSSTVIINKTIGPVCGNEVCEEGENRFTCPSDCAISTFEEIFAGDPTPIYFLAFLIIGALLYNYYQKQTARKKRKKKKSSSQARSRR